MPDDFFSLRPDVLDPEKAHLPLLLLDIDGVLNAYLYRPAETVLPDGAYTDLTEHSVTTTDGRAFRFWTSPRLIEALNSLHDNAAVEIAWLTTWQYQANACVSPTLGLPRFPVAAMQDRLSDYYWKPRAATEALHLGRPVIWIDDVEITQREHEAFAKDGGAHLLIKPNAEYGLLESDLKSIEEFLNLLSP